MAENSSMCEILIGMYDLELMLTKVVITCKFPQFFLKFINFV